MTKLLIMGATGNIGGALLRQLHAAGADVRAVVRDPSRAALPHGTEIVAGDLDDPPSVTAAASGVHAAFLLGSLRDLPGALTALRAAGVAHVVVLGSRSVIDRAPGNAISEMWAAAEAAVLASGLRWTLLRPSGFMSNALRWRPQLRAGDVVRVPFADVPIAAIHPDDLAAVAAAALTRPELAGQHLDLSGPEALLPATQLALLAHALARPLRLEPLSGEAARAELALSFPPAFVDAQLRFFTHGELDDARITPTVARILGRPPLPFSHWLAANLAAIRA